MRLPNKFGTEIILIQLQVSRFAGQEMMAIQKSDDEPDLMDLAKNEAPEFARTVLLRLQSLISNNVE